MNEVIFFALSVSNMGNAPLGTAAILSGLPDYEAAALDYSEEIGLIVNPFEVGETYLIKTVTMYYVGRVREVKGLFVVLEDASWVHWTGRTTTLKKAMSFGHKHFASGDNKPRTELVGVIGINIATVVTYEPGRWELPERPIS